MHLRLSCNQCRATSEHGWQALYHTQVPTYEVMIQSIYYSLRRAEHRNLERCQFAGVRSCSSEQADYDATIAPAGAAPANGFG